MAIVNVWYPNLKSRRDVKHDGIDKSDAQRAAYSFVDNVGHASLTLDRTTPQSYLSWWPNKDHTAFSTPTYVQDIQLERGPPSFTVLLDCLDEDSIRMWWDRVKLDGRAFPYRGEFFPADHKWTLDRNNCSHMVWLALKVGGAEKHAELIRWGADIVTPPQIHAYALRLKAVAAVSKLF